MIPNGWSLRKVRDVTEYFRSGDPFLKREYAPNGIAVIAKGDIKSHGRVEHSGKRFIPPHVAEEKGYSVCAPGELLVTTRDLTQKADVLGLAAPVPTDQEYLANQGANVMRLSNDELIPYFVYWTNGPVYRAHMRSHFVGSTQIHIRQGDLLDAPIWLPPDGEREAIVGVLGALDDKIEQNRRAARVLERLARAIFRAWFIDFEPITTKATGGTAYPSMPQDVFHTLPTEFLDSALGPIPQGWEVKAISGAFEVNPKRALSKGDIAPYLGMKDMPTRTHAPDKWIKRPFGSGMRFINGDTLVARITPCLENGKTAFVDFLDNGEVGWGSTEYIVLRPHPPLPEAFAYCLARTTEFRDFAIANMSGTSGRQRVSAAALDHFYVAVPNEDLARAFGDLVEPMFDWIRLSRQECRTLAELRDYLLPRLLSGQTRVGDAKRDAQEVA